MLIVLRAGELRLRLSAGGQGERTTLHSPEETAPAFVKTQETAPQGLIAGDADGNAAAEAQAIADALGGKKGGVLLHGGRGGTQVWLGFSVAMGPILRLFWPLALALRRGGRRPVEVVLGRLKSGVEEAGSMATLSASPFRGGPCAW